MVLYIKAHLQIYNEKIYTTPCNRAEINLKSECLLKTHIWEAANGVSKAQVTLSFHNV